MNLINLETLNKIRGRDLDTLVEFDDHGLLLGPDETIDAFAERLEKLAKNIEELDGELAENGHVDVLDITLRKDDRIPQSTYVATADQTQNLYGFTIDWVPGFFTSETMGFLFAGCAMYSYEEFFAIFIVRKSFKKKERWLIYSRSELIAHELCHIAHIGFKTHNFEELFAYQTAESRFRRLCGGVLRTTMDTYLILGAVISLLAAQILNTTLRPPMEWHAFPMPLIFTATLSVVAFVFARYVFHVVRISRARRRLNAVFGKGNSLAVLFRCSEQEIKQISRLQRTDAVADWLREQERRSIRWQIISRKFGRTPNDREA